MVALWSSIGGTMDIAAAWDVGLPARRTRCTHTVDKGKLVVLYGTNVILMTVLYAQT